MKNLLIKYASEITLKGLNKRIFEDALIKNIKEAMGREQKILKDSGRLYIKEFSEGDIEKITKVFGVLSVSVAEVIEKDIEVIGKVAVEQLREQSFKTFKVETKRGDKTFPLNSTELSRKIGGVILSSIPDINVDVHNPEVVLRIEIRSDCAYVFSKEYPGPVGMPYKTAGKGVLLLSGGIDSPVAGYMMAKRGLELIAVYYHSHPYTSERAKEKVIELAKILSQYTHTIKLYIVPFTKIQMEIIEKCPEDELTIIMRRYMTKIGEAIAIKEKALAVVTGESLAQVASQTLQSMYVTESGIEMPIFRPLIGMDKIDIIEISRKIGTFETSILPYEDCCTIFVPKHPKTKPRLCDIVKSEGVLNREELIKNAVEEAEIIIVE
jgi:thiamine biosynthesis protein ThiI